LALVFAKAVWDEMGGRRWRGIGSRQKMPLAAMVFQVIGLILMSWFVGVTAVTNSLLTVILGTLAFVVLAYSGGMFTKKPNYARNVGAGY